IVLSFTTIVALSLLCRYTYHLFIFFFQAEDGIRDRNVTGVQTCALPISQWERPHAASGRSHCAWLHATARRPCAGSTGGGPAREIGRASCRERAWVVVGEGVGGVRVRMSGGGRGLRLRDGVEFE